MKFYSIIFPLQFKCVVDHLSGDRATGNGSGVQVVLTTSTGCVHGGDGVGSPKRDPTELGRSAAEMALKSAAKVCVDQHMQVRAIFEVVLTIRAQHKYQKGLQKFVRLRKKLCDEMFCFSLMHMQCSFLDPF